jgi:hypothetical protein
LKPQPLPMACSLNADELVDRVRLLEEIGAGASEIGGVGLEATLRCRATDRMLTLLRGFAELEGNCCPFLDMTIRREGNDALLVISGPPGSEPVIEALRVAFASVDK